MIRRDPELLARPKNTQDIQATRIDLRMKPILYELWWRRIETEASCEGHLTHGLPYPWFDTPGHRMPLTPRGPVVVEKLGLPEIGATRYSVQDPVLSLPQKRRALLKFVQNPGFPPWINELPVEEQYSAIPAWIHQNTRWLTLPRRRRARC